MQFICTQLCLMQAVHDTTNTTLMIYEPVLHRLKAASVNPQTQNDSKLIPAWGQKLTLWRPTRMSAKCQ